MTYSRSTRYHVVVKSWDGCGDAYDDVVQTHGRKVDAERRATQIAFSWERAVKVTVVDTNPSVYTDRTIATYRGCSHDAFETRNEVITIARNNADEAFDQVDAYDSIEDAIASYEANVFDTLNERGWKTAQWHDLAAVTFANYVSERRHG